MTDLRLIDVEAWKTGADVVLSLEEIAEIERSKLAEVVAVHVDAPLSPCMNHITSIPHNSKYERSTTADMDGDTPIQ